MIFLVTKLDFKDTQELIRFYERLDHQKIKIDDVLDVSSWKEYLYQSLTSKLALNKKTLKEWLSNF